MERILGVNLSGWFIPEPWVTPSLYAATGASNAAELQEAMGTAAYNERMRRHYETFVSEDDFRCMAQIGLNAVRLPVPWYAFGSQESDASYISVVDYIDRAIEWAAKYVARAIPTIRPPRRRLSPSGIRPLTAVMSHSTCSSAWPIATARLRACWVLSCLPRRR